MTVELTSNATSYTVDGSVLTFATPFFQNSSDLLVWYIASNGDRTPLLEEDGAWTVEGENQPQGGTLTIASASSISAATAGTLLITTDVPPTQMVDLPRSGRFDTTEVMGALDKQMLLTQQLERADIAALRAPVDDLAGDMVLPNEANRKGKVQYYSATTGLPELLTPAALVALGDGSDGSDPALAMLTREKLGLKGDGTDDSIRLNQKLAEYSAAGGDTFYLSPEAGEQFYFRYPVRVPSFMTVIFVGPAVKLHPDARFIIEGSIATTPSTNKHRLLANVSAAATTLTVDTSPQGGGAVSAHFAVDDVLIIEGLADPAGNIIQRGEHRITAVDDSLRQLTFTPALAYDYDVDFENDDYETYSGGTPNYTLLSVAVRCALSSNGAEGDNVLSCESAQIGRLAVGDIALVEDEELSSDAVSGGSANAINKEIRRFIDINGDGANTVTLNARLVRTYATAEKARLIVLNPAIRACVQGATVEFGAAPAASPAARIPTFEIRYGYGSSFIECSVPNDDAFGSRGEAFLFSHSIECESIDCDVQNPKHLGAGDGIGHAFLYSTGCTATRARAWGCRHNIQFKGSTQCRALAATLGDDRLSAIDWAGLDEVECEAVDPIVMGGSRSTADSDTRTAFKFGDAANMVGPRRCRVMGASVGQYKGTDSRVISFEPGSVENVVRQLQADDIETLLYFSDNDGAPTLTAERCSIEETVVNGCVDRLMDIHGGRNGSATKTLVDLTVRDLRVYGATALIHIRQAAGAKFFNVRVYNHTVDVTEPYFCTAIDVTGFMAVGSFLEGLRAGFAMTDCPSFIICDSRFVSFSGGTVVLQDNGGNTSAKWHYNHAIGFVGSKDEVSASSGLNEFPLKISASADYLTVS